MSETTIKKEGGCRPGGEKAVMALLSLARLGYAQCFFGNLYEALVRIPDTLANQCASQNEQLHKSILGKGSPVRYYLPAIPIVAGATLSAVKTGWKYRAYRPLLGATAVSSFTVIGVTVYLVRTVNLKLLFGAPSIPSPMRETLLRRWYRLNRVRLLASATAWCIAGLLVSRLAGAVGIWAASRQSSQKVGTAPGSTAERRL